MGLSQSLSDALYPRPARSLAIGGGRPAADWVSLADTAIGDAPGAAVAAAAVAAAVAAGSVAPPADPAATIAAAQGRGCPFPPRVAAWLHELSGFGLQAWPSAAPPLLASAPAPASGEAETPAANPAAQLAADAFLPLAPLHFTPPPLPPGEAVACIDEDGDDDEAAGAEGAAGHAAAAASAAEGDAAVPGDSELTAAAQGGGAAAAPRVPFGLKPLEERFLPALIRAVHGSAEGIDKLRARFR